MANRLVSGRGGSVVVSPRKGFGPGQSVVLFEKESSGDFSSGLPDVVMHDVMAHAVGLELAHPVESARYLVAQPGLVRKRAELFISVDGVGGDVLAMYPHLKLLGMSKSAHLTETSAAQDNIALLSSLVTGAPVKEHGIVSSHWHLLNGNRIEAFSDSTSLRRTRSLFENSRVSFVASASRQFAVAHSLSGLFWNARDFTFESSLSRQSFPIDRSFSHVQRVLGGVLANGAVELKGAAGQKALFSLSRASEVEFLAELELVLSAVSSVSANNVPCLFGFGISGLSQFKLAGVSSTVFQVALYNLDAAVASAIAQAKQHFGRISWHVAFLDQSGVVRESLQVAERVAKEFSQVLVAREADVFHLVDDACERLQGELWTQDMVATCSDSTLTLARRSARAAVAASGSGSNATESGISFEEIVSFQLLFWLGVVYLILFVTAASLLSGVGIPSDSPLVRNLPDIFRSQGIPLKELIND